ncbi:MAG: urea carboxylase-associated family protein [Acidimicrobiia bacterium]
MMKYGEAREDFILQPVSGRALPVYEGEVLRIQQVGEGQCVDFNCFNLYDYKERMSVGMSRRQGFRLGKNGYLLSAPPRSRLMMQILELSDSCITDLLGSRCSGELFEATWGFTRHTNCQDTLAEAIGEFGLTPDDTHDSFNMWMNTGWDDRGRFFGHRNPAKPGDYIDLLAHMDCLCVPAICGSGDITGTSNYALHPIRVQVFEATLDTQNRVDDSTARFGGLDNQRTPEHFRIAAIKADRALVSDREYVPQFINFPLKYIALTVDLSISDSLAIARMIENGKATNAEEAIKTGAFSWYVASYSKPSPFGSSRLQ